MSRSTAWMAFFSRQPQAFQGATQGRQAEADAEFLACFGLQFYQGQIGLRLYPCQDALVGGVKSPLLAAAMGSGGEGAGGAAALQELFDERNTDAKSSATARWVAWSRWHASMIFWRKSVE